MDVIMEEPHKLVLEPVRQRWANKRSKGFFTRLLEFGEVKPVAIEIVQTDSFDDSSGLCIGKTLKRWWYNNEGLKSVPLDADTSKEKLEYCWYCIDKEKKRLAIVWANILPMASRRKKIHHFHDGVVYKIIDETNVESYEPISVWIE